MSNFVGMEGSRAVQVQVFTDPKFQDWEFLTVVKCCPGKEHANDRSGGGATELGAGEMSAPAGASGDASSKADC